MDCTWFNPPLLHLYSDLNWGYSYDILSVLGKHSLWLLVSSYYSQVCTPFNMNSSFFFLVLEETWNIAVTLDGFIQPPWDQHTSTTDLHTSTTRAWAKLRQGKANASYAMVVLFHLVFQVELENCITYCTRLL